MTEPTKPQSTPAEGALLRAVVLRMTLQHIAPHEIAKAVGREPNTIKRILADALREVEACSLDDAKLVLVYARASLQRDLERIEARMEERPNHGYDAYEAKGRTLERYLALHGIRINGAQQVTQININSPGAALAMRDAPSSEIAALIAEAEEAMLAGMREAKLLPAGPGADPEEGAGEGGLQILP